MGCWGWVGCGALRRRQEVRVERGREETGGDYDGRGELKPGPGSQARPEASCE